MALGRGNSTQKVSNSSSGTACDYLKGDSVRVLSKDEGRGFKPFPYLVNGQHFDIQIYVTLRINRKCQRESRKRAEIGESCYMQSTVRICIYIYMMGRYTCITERLSVSFCCVYAFEPYRRPGETSQAAELYHRFGVQLYQMFPGAL